MNYYQEKRQLKRFCGINAQHQNAEAERSIQKIMCMARIFLILILFHWIVSGFDDLLMW